MITLADLHRAVNATIQSKRLGRPVFARLTLQGPDNPGVPLLAALSTLVRDWINQPLARLYAVGSLASGQVSLTWSFQDGATSVVTYSRCRPLGNGIDLMLIGNRGVIYHDFGSAEAWEESMAREGPKGVPAIQDAIERALRSGKPEPVAKEDSP